MRKPVFLDRDGVINIDRKPYIVSADGIELLPGALDGLATLYQAGFDLYGVSNQQGVAKGFIPESELPRMTERIRDLIKPHGVMIRHIEYCTAMNDAGDPCRKPAPGMILTIRDRFHLDLDGCFMVGDRWSDIEAGARAGLRTVLVMTGETKGDEWREWKYRPEAAFPCLREAADYIVSESRIARPD